MKLNDIQKLVKVPKSQTNDFGKYKYRSCEDIVEAVKPIINNEGFWLTMTDEVVLIGTRFYIKATATITNGTDSYSAIGYAREEETKKGMDGSQITGAASSYARKYALNGLFAIDDAKDSDATNKGEEKPTVPQPKPKPEFTINSPKFKEAHKAISEGTYTIEQMKDKYTLSESTIKVLTSKYTE
jgi:hypothetical protein